MVKKVLITILIIAIIFAFFSSPVKAIDISNVFGGAENFVDTGKENANNNTINGEALNDVSGTIFNVLVIAGVCIAVIMGTVLGIQFITGSVEQKVKVKESLIPFIVGCVVIFSAFGIWRLVIIILR